MSRPLIHWEDWSGGEHYLLFNGKTIAAIRRISLGCYQAKVNFGKPKEKGFCKLDNARKFCEHRVLKIIDKMVDALKGGVESRHVSEW